MEYFVIYVMLMMDNLRMGIGFIISGICIYVVIRFIMFVNAAIDEGDAIKYGRKPTGEELNVLTSRKKSNAQKLKLPCIGLGIAIILLSLTPSTKHAALIVGGGQVYQVLTSEAAKELSSDAYTIVKGVLGDYADEYRKGVDTKK